MARPRGGDEGAAPRRAVEAFDAIATQGPSPMELLLERLPLLGQRDFLLDSQMKLGLVNCLVTMLLVWQLTGTGVFLLHPMLMLLGLAVLMPAAIGQYYATRALQKEAAAFAQARATHRRFNIIATVALVVGFLAILYNKLARGKPAMSWSWHCDVGVALLLACAVQVFCGLDKHKAITERGERAWTQHGFWGPYLVALCIMGCWSGVGKLFGLFSWQSILLFVCFAAQAAHFLQLVKVSRAERSSLQASEGTRTMFAEEAAVVAPAAEAEGLADAEAGTGGLELREE